MSTNATQPQRPGESPDGKQSLPDSFHEFARDGQCEDCYEIVDPSLLEDGRCPGCRHRAPACAGCGERVARELLDDNGLCPGCWDQEGDE